LRDGEAFSIRRYLKDNDGLKVIWQIVKIAFRHASVNIQTGSKASRIILQSDTHRFLKKDQFLVAFESWVRERREMKTLRYLPLILVAFCLTALPALANGWGDHYKEALATAAKENKKVLLDFTGSDWCGWCIRLKKETFDQSEFKNYADKNLILVEVDFPNGKTLPPEVKKQNDALQEQYHIEGFPTLILLDPQGKEITKNVGYLPGGPKGFINWVNSK
jgi:thioredoxin-related protein